jgi:hypothetical protein
LLDVDDGGYLRDAKDREPDIRIDPAPHEAKRKTRWSRSALSRMMEVEEEAASWRLTSRSRLSNRCAAKRDISPQRLHVGRQ